MKPITVLICDDSALIRQMFSELLSSAPDITVVDTANDPLDAREKIKLHNPDVLTLDIEMPKMDGLSFLERIMNLRPMPVVMASTLTQKGADATIRALELGAFDYISKPIHHHTRETIGALGEELIAKVRAAATSNIRHRNTNAHTTVSTMLTFSPPKQPAHTIIAMGSSTGGVEALRDVLTVLPANMPPIVIAQHMPENFTASFAARLNTLCAMEVQEARHHCRLQPGNVYIAPGNQHLRITKIGMDYVCKLDDGALVSSHRPSVDVLFHSVAEAAGKHAVGVILTGMGRDGAEGLLAMRQAGGATIGQNESTCVVYGMPRVAFTLGAVEKQASLYDIPKHMIHHCEQSEKAVPHVSH